MPNMEFPFKGSINRASGTEEISLLYKSKLYCPTLGTPLKYYSMRYMYM